MCAAPISAGELAWTPADADWERLQVAAAEAFAAHDLAGAAESWAKALRTARSHFEPHDPRLATSLANQAFALRLCEEPVAERLFADALEVWDAAPAWLARQRFAPRARSSIFHLRLEAKHGGAYDASLRRRAETVLNTARAATAALAAGAPSQALDRASLQGLRSAPLDAMRKVLAAAHLLAVPTPDQDAEVHAAQEGS
jgi:uncharacterized protein (DUF1684 family)